MGRQRWAPRPYQAEALAFADSHPRCGLFLDMSLGKTAIVLTELERLVYDSMEVRKAVVVAPPRVARDTWSAEAAKWEHLRDLRVLPVVGAKARREALLASDADVYVVSNALVPWLVENWRADFDALVIDELSAFKSSGAKRFKALRKVSRSCKRVMGLTGTPSPNGLADLWAEAYLLDAGEALGRTLTAYRERWFKPGARRGAVVYEWVPRRGAAEEIHEAIGGFCISMRKDDLLDLPPKTYIDVPVTLDPKPRALYDRVERDLVAEIGDGEVLVAQNAAALSNKLRQIADGMAYDDAGEAVEVHTAKLDTLKEMAEAANGAPMLVFYAYRPERDLILREVPGARVLDSQQDMEDWNEGRIPVAVAHPASVGHGLNLQYGGSTVVWYGLTWSLELYQQANDRLHRPGQKGTVTVYRLVAEGTVDEACLDALDGKRRAQDALLDYLKSKGGE